jgi:hypothetical protein
MTTNFLEIMVMETSFVWVDLRNIQNGKREIQLLSK